MNVKFCLSCGSAVVPGGRFCGNCGYQLPVDPAPAPGTILGTPPPPAPRPIAARPEGAPTPAVPSPFRLSPDAPPSIQREAPRKRRSHRWAVVSLVAVLAAATVLTVVLWNRGVGSAGIDEDGGTVRSGDGRVVATFAPGDVDPGTTISVVSDVAAPPPPVQIAPLGPAFAIDPTAGHARQGRVTVSYQALPENVPAEDVVMLILDGAQWEILDTEVDPVAKTATATWPHFSIGGLGFLDPYIDLTETVADGISDFAGWTWDQANAAFDWTVAQGKELVGQIASLELAIVGGTTDSPTCTPVGDEWSFTATSPGAGLPAPMAGCAAEGDGDGWDAKLGNHAPVPYLIGLPAGMTVDLGDIIDAGYDLPDTAVALALATQDQAIVAAGKTLGVHIDPSAGTDILLRGHLDPYTLAVKVLMVVAAYYSRGESAAATTEMKVALKASAEELYAARAASGKPLLSDIAKTLGHYSDHAKADRAAGITTGVKTVDLAFNYLDLAGCGLAVGRKAAEDVASGRVDQPSDLAAAVTDAVGVLLGDCYPTFIKGVFTIFKQQLDPKNQAKASSKIAEAAVEQAKSVITVGLAGQLNRLREYTGIDYTSAGLDLHRSGSAPGGTTATTWLYQTVAAGVVAVGASGVVRPVQIDGVDYPDSTSFWVGCNGTTATTPFALNGKYSRLTTTLALDPTTPPDLVVGISLVADGTPIQSWTLRPGDRHPVDVTITGTAMLVLEATSTTGTCGTSAFGYGIAADAALT